MLWYGDMQLATYLRRNRIPIRDFAETIGLTAEGVRLLVTGQRQPRRATMDSIMAATGGKVGHRDWFPTPRHRSAEQTPAPEAA